MSGMKLIMEGWRHYVKEEQSNIGSLLSPQTKEILFGLPAPEEDLGEGVKSAIAGTGLAAAVAAGTMASQTPSMPDVGIEQTEEPIAAHVAPEMPVEEMSWSKAPTSGGLIWVTPGQIADDYILPSLGITAKDYKENLESRKVRGSTNDFYDIESLDKMLFGNSGTWAYTQQKGIRAFDSHPDIGADMLPPAWSVAFEVYAEKVGDQIKQVRSLSPAELQGLADSTGVGVEDILTHVDEIEKETIKRLET